MPEEHGIKFIEDEVKKRITSFNERRKFYRRGTFTFTILSAILSAVTTFLIGFGQIYDIKLVSVIALGTSASMTILTAWDSFYGHRDRWIQNNDTLMKLYELYSDIQYKKAVSNCKMNMEEINAFYMRYGNVLREANLSWREKRDIKVV